MNIAQAVPLADTWVFGGWWIVMAILMVLCMGAMMFGMARRSRGSRQSWSRPWERSVTKESPVEILDRRFAEGAISTEDYRARREVLLNGTAKGNGANKGEALTAPGAGEGRQ